MSTISNRVFYICLSAIAIVCLTASGLTVMDYDAAQYAEMSREMMLSKHPLQLFCLGQPYLDKPPLLFWITAISFKIFGVGNVAYRLPSLLFAALSVFSTYRFTKLLYTEQIARIATLMLASTFAFYLLTNDVRTDTILIGAVVFSIWQLTSYLLAQRTFNLVLGAVGIGLALLAKGPIGLLVPVYTLLPPLILKKEWKKIFDWKYSIAFIIIALLLLPMCVGLYQQYGLHGLQFYFWTQSFGRITGENIWNNNPDPFFLIHTTLWAFMPWTLFLFVGFFLRIKEMYVSKTLNVGTENITTFGFLFTLISLMLSKYQLPHYIFIVYPLGAVIAADTFVKLSTKQWVRFTQFSLIAVVWTFVGLVNLYVFAISGWLLLLLICCVSVASFIFISSKDLLLLTLASILSCNLLMSLNFFPQLQRYQTSEEIGRYLRNQHIPIEKLMVHYSCFSFALAFYYQDDYASCLAPVDIEQAFKKTNEQYILIDDMNFPILQSHAGWSPVIVKTYYKFKITQLNLAFLNPKTRLNALRKIYLVKLTLNDIH